MGGNKNWLRRPSNVTKCQLARLTTVLGGAAFCAGLPMGPGGARWHQDAKADLPRKAARARYRLKARHRPQTQGVCCQCYAKEGTVTKVTGKAGRRPRRQEAQGRAWSEADHPPRLRRGAVARTNQPCTVQPALGLRGSTLGWIHRGGKKVCVCVSVSDPDGLEASTTMPGPPGSWAHARGSGIVGKNVCGPSFWGPPADDKFADADSVHLPS